MVHVLKTSIPFFSDVELLNKQFELRKNDRGFAVNDFLALCEHDPSTSTFTGKVVVAQVNYILPADAGVPGLLSGYVVMDITNTETLVLGCLRGVTTINEDEVRQRLREALASW